MIYCRYIYIHDTCTCNVEVISTVLVTYMCMLLNFLNLHDLIFAPPKLGGKIPAQDVNGS